MITKFVAWVKALFAPANIEDSKVDEYIAKQHQAAGERQITKRRRHNEDEVVLKATVKDDQVTFSDSKGEVVNIGLSKTLVTPPKPLDEQLKGVELPSYAKGKTLPPKAKRQFIKQSKTVATARPRRLDDTPHSSGGHGVSHGIDPVNAALYGYAAATVLQSDTPAVEDSRSGAAISSYRSGYSTSDDSSIYSSSSSSSSSSYDSGSYDSGSSSSCD